MKQTRSANFCGKTYWENCHSQGPKLWGQEKDRNWLGSCPISGFGVEEKFSATGKLVG